MICKHCGNGINHRRELLMSFGPICSTHNGDGCGRKTDNLTIDHIIPKALGGTGDITNKQLLCKPCHYKKSARQNRELGLDSRPRKVMVRIAPSVGSSAPEAVGTAPRTYQVS